MARESQDNHWLAYMILKYLLRKRFCFHNYCFRARSLSTGFPAPRNNQASIFYHLTALFA